VTNDTSDDRRDNLADKRTETAFHRTLLAEQRTYSAWVRTGLASTATGFAIAKLMTEAQPAWLVRWLAILFIVAGGCMFLLAFWAYRDALAKVNELPSGGIPLWILAILSTVLFVAAAMGLYLITRSV
jgi:putative membrane protein